MEIIKTQKLAETEITSEYSSHVSGEINQQIELGTILQVVCVILCCLFKNDISSFNGFARWRKLCEIF